MHNNINEFCLEIHIRIAFSMIRLDFKMLCFKILHFEDIYNAKWDSKKKKNQTSHISGFENKTDEHLNFTLPPTFSFFLERKKRKVGLHMWLRVYK